MLEWAGSVSGATETACSNSTPSAASPSKVGVCTSLRAVGAHAIRPRRVERDDDEVEAVAWDAGGRDPRSTRLAVLAVGDGRRSHQTAAAPQQRDQDRDNPEAAGRGEGAADADRIEGVTAPMIAARSTTVNWRGAGAARRTEVRRGMTAC